MANFVDVMQKITKITTGLEDAEVTVASLLFFQSVPGSSSEVARKVASERRDVIKNNIDASLEHATVSVDGAIEMRKTAKIRVGQVVEFSEKIIKIS